MGENVTFGVGSIFFNGCEVKGIPDFECSNEDATKAFADASTILYNTEPFSLTATVKLNMYTYMKLIGLYDWALDYCPNRRVVHLAKFGRTQRVRNKNFRRALRIMGKECDVK